MRYGCVSIVHGIGIRVPMKLCAHRLKVTNRERPSNSHTPNQSSNHSPSWREQGTQEAQVRLSDSVRLRGVRRAAPAAQPQAGHGKRLCAGVQRSASKNARTEEAAVAGYFEAAGSQAAQRQRRSSAASRPEQGRLVAALARARAKAEGAPISSQARESRLRALQVRGRLPTVH